MKTLKIISAIIAAVFIVAATVVAAVFVAYFILTSDVKLDEEKNLIGKNLPEPALISTPDSKVKVFVVETDEELVIASDTRRVVEESRK